MNDGINPIEKPVEDTFTVNLTQAFLSPMRLLERTLSVHKQRQRRSIPLRKLQKNKEERVTNPDVVELNSEIELLGSTP